MRLHHLHLPGPILYSHSLRLQEALLEKHFAHKTAIRASQSSGIPPGPAPNPALLTFQTHPVYTVGRRHLTANPISQAQISFLTTNSSTASSQSSQHVQDLASFYPSPRGGLLTYHAPGQLTAYLILDLRAHSLTPRCYIRLVENTVIRAIAKYGVHGGITEDPGVWILKRDTSNEKHQDAKLEEQEARREKPGSVACELEQKTFGLRLNDTTGEQWTPTDRKICAIGVQVSRGITSHGIGLNVFDSPIQSKPNSPPRELYTLPRTLNAKVQDDDFDTFTRLSTQLDHYRTTSSASEPGTAILAPGYLSWGFSRIVACGLEGKSVTWLSKEQPAKSSLSANNDVKLGELQTPSIDNVAETLAMEVSRSLELDENEIQKIHEDEVLD